MSLPDNGSPSSRSGWASLIAWGVERKVVALLSGLLVIGLGLFVSPFDWLPAGVERSPIPVDAIPDIGENQQIVFTEWPGRSPRDVEDQVTYPLTTALMGIPGVRTVRSSSAFGFSSLYVIFEEDIEFYWARARILEKLSSLRPGTLPDNVTPALGPDATALGQIFWYTLEGQSSDGRTVGGWDPDELRTIQDWTVRFALQSVPGVSEVASVGGFVREYQVDVDPEAMRGHGVNLAQIADAVRKSNLDVGARTLEVNGVEYLVRGKGFIEGVEDLEATVVESRSNTPIRIRDIGHVTLGPALRRGALDDEGAPAVGGVVVARYQENPLEVIESLKQKISEVQPGLPSRVLEDGTVSRVTIVPFYDRTQLIDETLGTLSSALFQQILITVIVVFFMLRSMGPALVVSSMLPLGVLGAFIAMRVAEVDANIMALGGIAIAIGAMVDIGIVFVENISQHLAKKSPEQSTLSVVVDAVAEVAPAVMTSVLTTIVSFIPVFGLNATDLRLFGPLAFTKTFAMIAALILAVTVLPSLSVIINEARGHASTSGRFERLRYLRPKGILYICLGIVVFYQHHLAGGLIAAMGLHQVVLGALPDSWSSKNEMIQRVGALVAVSLLLAKFWNPLGFEFSALANWLFVASTIGSLLLLFKGFEFIYPLLLFWILRNRTWFLPIPCACVLIGAMVWLGAGRSTSFLPNWVEETSASEWLKDTFPGLGREYMPPFDEGSFLYMPTTMPHASIGEALEMLSEMDAAIASIPEVDRVVGKIGRVESALDPAPVSMIETVITYHPEYVDNPSGKRTRLWRDHIRSPEDIWAEIVEAARRPGVTSAPLLMPINARLVMLQSGMRAPMGIKVKGPNLEVIEAFGIELEQLLKKVPEIRSDTVFADRVVGKPYLEISLNRESIGRYGLRVVDVQNVLQIALGGKTLTRTVEGRERYPVRVRYMREERDNIEAVQRIFVPTPGGEQIPITQLASIDYVRGPQTIRAEDTFLTSYVLFDKVKTVDDSFAVQAASHAIDEALQNGALNIPSGVSYQFAGTYEKQMASESRLLILIPLALIIVFILLYLQFRKVSTAGIIFSGVMVAMSGGFIFLWLYDQPWFLNINLFGLDLRDLFQIDTVNLSVAVWIGFIALVGVATDDGVVMSTYLKSKFSGITPGDVGEVHRLVVEGGRRRIRACLMTTATTILALLPVVTSSGRGADVMVPMALPLIGGMGIELLTLFVVPTLYAMVEEHSLREQ